MTAKDTFLKKILVKIETYKAAYEYNKNLPDDFFEDLQSDATTTAIATVSNPAYSSIIDHGSDSGQDIISEYGKNKKTVLQILSTRKSPLLKTQIILDFERITGQKQAIDIVTNALTALKSDGVVMGYKPNGLRFRGYYWGLVDWLDENGNMKPEHIPLIIKPRTIYSEQAYN